MRMIFIPLAFISLLSGNEIYAQDMSGWSDKTICRLVKQQSDNVAFIAEAKSRKLDCIQTVSKPELKTTSGFGIMARELPEIAQSELRSIKVPKEWEIIGNPDNKVAFMEAFGAAHDSSGFIETWNMNSYVDDCVKELSEFSPKWINSVGNPFEVTASSRFIRCQTIFVHNHFKNPENGINNFEHILLNWAKTKPVKFPHRGGSKVALMGQGYSAMMLMGDFAAFYALYYHDFDYTDEERASIDQYFSDWFVENDITPKPSKARCNLKKPITQTYKNSRVDTDNCGSNRWRMAVGGILLGLRTSDQSLFDAGVRHLEIALATIDKNGIFVSWANKGALAFSYTRQLPEVLTILATALESVGYDFYEHETPQGKKIHEVYAAFFKSMKEPELLYRHGKNSWNYVGEDLRKFKKLPIEEQLLDEMVYYNQQVQASIGYIQRYRPDLKHLTNYKMDWNRYWNSHLGVFTTVSGIMLHEIYHEENLRKKIAELPSASSFDFSEYELVNFDKTLICDVEVIRYLGEEEGTIADMMAAVEGTDIEFYRENWNTGPAEKVNLFEEANLKMVKNVGLVGRAPVYTMFGSDEAPIYLTFGGVGASQLENTHLTFFDDIDLGIGIKFYNCY